MGWFGYIWISVPVSVETSRTPGAIRLRSKNVVGWRNHAWIWNSFLMRPTTVLTICDSERPVCCVFVSPTQNQSIVDFLPCRNDTIPARRRNWISSELSNFLANTFLNSAHNKSNAIIVFHHSATFLISCDSVILTQADLCLFAWRKIHSQFTINRMDTLFIYFLFFTSKFWIGISIERFIRCSIADRVFELRSNSKTELFCDSVYWNKKYRI